MNTLLIIKTLASSFFSVPLDQLKSRTRISSISKNHHDQILFSFEIEKYFRIDLDEEEVGKVHFLTDYAKLVAKYLTEKEQSDANQFKKAA